MTYKYRLVPESSLPASTRAAGREALELAAKLEGIGNPQLFWFLPADRPEHKVCNESPRPLAGWTQRDEIFIAADLSDEEVWATVAHECNHLYTAVTGYATMISRGRSATDKQVTDAQEAEAERATAAFMRFHYPKAKTTGKR